MFDRHVAIIEIQSKEFRLTPIPLRTVRPFVMDQVVLAEASEEEGNGGKDGALDLNDSMSIGRYLRARVSYGFYYSLLNIDACRSTH